MSSHATETAADTETALPALGDEFFDAADQLVEFDYGISYLRSARIAPEKLLYFKPVTPGIVGVTLLGLLASQAGDGPVDVVYGDLDRIPLGIPTIEKIVARVLNLDASSPSSRTVYFLEGRGAGDHSANSQNVVLLDELRAAGLSDIHIARLIARFFVQSSGVRVFNFVSPRKRSLAMFHIAAKRHTLVSWDNVVLEFGFDYFSCTGSEIIDLQDAGVEARNICIFAKTAREMAEQTGIKILYSASLESIYGGCESRLLATRVEEVRSSAFVAFEKTPRTAAFSQIRISGGDKLILDDGRAEMGDRGFAYLVLGGAQPTAETMRVMAAAECRRGPCISIPAMVVQRRSGGNLFIRPNVERMNEAIAKGLLPAGLFDVPLAGFDVKTVERIWQQYRSVPGEGVSLSRFLSSYFAEPGLRFTSMGHDTVVSCGERDMQCLDAAVVARRTTAARARSQTSDSP